MAPASEIVRRLLDAGLLSTGDVVDGDLTVHDLSRSNAVWLVDGGPGLRYVVKVSGPERDDLQGSSRVEAQLYEGVAADPVLRAEAPLPMLVGRYGDLLVLAPVGEDIGLGLAQRLRDKGATARDGRLFGDALGRWRAVAGRLPRTGLAGRRPWVMTALHGDRPPFLDEHPGTRRLGELLRPEPVLREALAGAASGWRRDAVIHGDVRWDNAVVATDPASGAERLLLVDLEFADVGEAAWDLAGVLAEPLSVAATEGGVGPDETFRVPDRRGVGRHLRALRPFLGCFASAYRGAAGPATADDDLDRAAGLVPARLVQIAFQHAAWNLETGVVAGLAVAGLAAGLVAEPRLLARALCEPVAAVAGRGGHSP